jgi:hypothetical protein
MKFLIKARIPVEMGNKLIKDGSLLTMMNEYFAKAKPEALYFTITGGKRTVVFVVNLPSADKLPEFTEPLWMGMNAELYWVPVADQKEFAKSADYFATLRK